jgi:hypothetical protein
VTWRRKNAEVPRSVNGRPIREQGYDSPTYKCATERGYEQSGYYEWQDTPSGKQPWHFTASDGSPLLNRKYFSGWFS